MRAILSRHLGLGIIIGAFILSWQTGCQAVGIPGTGSSTPTISAAPTQESPIPSTVTPAQEINALTLWLPPIFRPDGSTPGSEILRQRIADFEATHPGVTVTVRLKAVSGSGGLRDSLSMAAAAAPGSLPDVVALDQPNLRAAALKGLIFPLDSLILQETAAGLYPYAEAITKLDSGIFGRPFAGDAVVLGSFQASSPEGEAWPDSVSWGGNLFLPLADSRSLFLFFGYYAAGGLPPASVATAGIQPEPLERELTWLRELWDAGVLSPESMELDTPEATLVKIQRFDQRAISSYSSLSRKENFYANYPPTPEGARYTLATCWSWSIATPDANRQRKAAELLQWLSAPEFLAAWSSAQGFLPVSSEVLADWPAGREKDLAAGLSEHAAPYPSEEISAALGPVLSQAARRVLIEGSLPADAALEAAHSVQQ
jgi:ABC-type glycerol-3-phosphate transport system substrate-binding protein